MASIATVPASSEWLMMRTKLRTPVDDADVNSGTLTVWAGAAASVSGQTPTTTPATTATSSAPIPIPWLRVIQNRQSIAPA